MGDGINEGNERPSDAREQNEPEKAVSKVEGQSLGNAERVGEGREQCVRDGRLTIDSSSVQNLATNPRRKLRVLVASGRV